MRAVVLGFVAACLFISYISSNAQSRIRGLVVSQEDDTPLPYANVYLTNNPSTGTVTNAEGYFLLNVSLDFPFDVTVSFVGFENKIVTITSPNTDTPIAISLRESKKYLQEVVIMPDSSILTLLEDAFENIDLNYPRNNQLVKGFYRETNQTIPDEKFIYFSESIIEFYQKSYENNHFGPVRITNGGKAELKSRQRYSNIFFYAGPYIAQRLDFVRQREEFINPKTFYLYNYNFKGETEYNGEPVYIIEFSPKDDNGSYQGNLHIEKKSLAYVGANYMLSEHGIRKRNKVSVSGFEFQQRKFTVSYRKNTDRWNIDVAVQDGFGKTKKDSTGIRYTNEYVTLSRADEDINPIEEKESIPYSGIYTLMDEKFNNDYWKDSGELARTKKLNETVTFLFDDGMRDKANNQILLANDSVDKSARKKFINFASRLTTGLSLGVAPFSVQSGNYSIEFKNAFLSKRTFPDRSFTPIIVFDMSYFLSRRFLLSFEYFNSLNSQSIFSEALLNVRWNIHLAGWRKPLYVLPGVGFYYLEAAEFLDKTDLQKSFTLNGHLFKTNTITPGLGEVNWGATPSLEIIYKSGKLFSFFCQSGTFLTFNQQSKIYLKESDSFFLPKRPVTSNFNTEGIEVIRNGSVLNSSAVKVNNFRPFFTIGIKIGVK